MLKTTMRESNPPNWIMQQLSSQISRENLRNYKSKNYNLDLINKCILNNRTDIEKIDVTPIGKLLYKMINFNSENNNIV